MNKKVISIFVFAVFAAICPAQQNHTWDKWSWLTGTWAGEGEGAPGQGSGTFSFSYDLDKNILVRKSHSEYPATTDKPATIHDDLMIIYPGTEGNQDKAVYFDNEGHTIFYSVDFNEKSIILTSERSHNGPVFKLVYKLLDPGTVSVSFQMSRDGVDFMTYVEGKSRKVKP
jgi:hypothetical protein